MDGGGCDFARGLLSQNHSHKVCGAGTIGKRYICEGQKICLRGVNVALTIFCNAGACGFGSEAK